MAKRWSQPEDDRLQRLYADPTMPTARIATLLGRTAHAVAKRASLLGVQRPGPNRVYDELDSAECVSRR